MTAKHATTRNSSCSYSETAASSNVLEKAVTFLDCREFMQALFESFFLGGFECATHRRHHTGQIDVLRATQHDTHAADDYRMLAEVGIRTVRDGLRWHLIERTPGHYDWSSFLSMFHASLATGTRVIWDLCHWGVPDGLDPFSPEFVTRFADFASAAAAFMRDHTDETLFFCPINEISFWSWIGGDRQVFFPYAKARGNELKRRLVEATVAATKRIQERVPGSRFLQCEPIIHISGTEGRAHSPVQAARHTAAQYEAWDMIAGRQAPELGGDESCLDLIGCNYYWNNQWIHRGPPTALGHPRHRPLHQMLFDVHRRYARPMLLSETGAEGETGPGWLGMIASEARQALRAGVDLQGVCLYPVMDYPGWDDRRHCHCGLIATDSDWERRMVRTDLAEELAMQEELFQRLRSGSGERGEGEPDSAAALAHMNADKVVLNAV